jgi:signal transduction histidine kinase
VNSVAPHLEHRPALQQAILLIGPDDELAHLVAGTLSGTRDWSLCRADDLASATRHATEPAPRLVLAALETGQADATDLIAAVRRLFPESPILALGDLAPADATRLAAAGARGYLHRNSLTRASLARAMRATLTRTLPSRLAQNADIVMALSASATFGVLEASADGVVRACNPRLAALLGYHATNELVGRELRGELGVSEATWQTWLALPGRVVPVELTLTRTDGEHVYCRGDLRLRRNPGGAVLGLELLLVDFTEQRQLEHALVGAARTEALRALTGSAAHDFNNLLTIIVGNLYLLVESLRDNEGLLTKVKAARDAARRGADLARQLLSFATQKPVEPEVVALPRAIGNVELLLERALGKRIELSTALEPDCWPIRIDVTQLESALINLAVNARDAMDGHGRVTISASNASIDKTRASALGVEPGDYVDISVTDSGPGVPAAIRQDIFKAFYTTKSSSGGTGLGLNMVQRLVTSAGGTVELVDPSGGGACFRLLFPRAESDALRPVDMTQPLSTLPTGHERVFVQSSDLEVATTIHQLLSVLGYDVQTVTEPAPVLNTLAESGAALLVCEAGTALLAKSCPLLAQAREPHSHLKILLIADDAAVIDDPEVPIQGVLRKPLVLAELATTVRRALDK